MSHASHGRAVSEGPEPLPHPHLGVRGYLYVWAALAAFTAIEIGVTFLPISHAVIVSILLTLAVVKAGLVALYFMHLKFDGRFLRWVAVGPMAFVLILLAALLVDLYFVAAVSQGKY